MTQRTPLDVNFGSIPPNAQKLGTAEVLWTHRPTFGPYLRGLRDQAGLSLRAASADLGLSYSYLSKLETGSKSAPPSLKLLQRLADVYCRDLRELMHEAGFTLNTPPEVDARMEGVDERFRRLVLNDAVRPMRMDERVIELIPELVKRQWIDFAYRLEAALREGETVTRLMSSGPPRPPDAG